MEVIILFLYWTITFFFVVWATSKTKKYQHQKHREKYMEWINEGCNPYKEPIPPMQWDEGMIVIAFMFAWLLWPLCVLDLVDINKEAKK